MTANCWLWRPLGLVLVRRQPLLKRRFALSAIEFMLTRERDIEAFYKQRRPVAGNWLTPIMCHRVTSTFRLCKRENRYKAETSFRLHPNRARSSLRKLRQCVAAIRRASSLVCAASLTACCTLAAPYIMTDLNHLLGYENCDLELKRHYERDSRHRWFWCTHLTLYRLSMTLADLIENLFLSFYPLLCVCHAFGAIFLQTEDLKSYRKFMQQGVELVHDERRREWRSDSGRHQPASGRPFSAMRRISCRERPASNLEPLSELHGEKSSQSRPALLISGIITSGPIAWIVSPVVVGGAAVRYSTLMGLIVASSFVAVGRYCFMLFALHSNSLATYHSLASLLPCAKQPRAWSS